MMIYLTITNTKHIVPSFANISAVKLTAMTFIRLFKCSVILMFWLLIQYYLFLPTFIGTKNIFHKLIIIMKNVWKKIIRRIIIENLIMTCIIIFLIIFNLILLLIGHHPYIRTCIHVYEIYRYLLPLQLMCKYNISVIS